VSSDPLVVSAWGSVAEAYAAAWGPRFQPFLDEALEAFEPGPGPLWVPGCGPGVEAGLLGARWPERSLIATDPAPEMVSLARSRVSGGLTSVELGAADAPPAQALGGIFSSFVLQLLPDRAAALRAWSAALAPEGRVAIVFWPRQADEDAWGHLGRAMLATGRERPEWEGPLLAQLPELGFELIEARDLRHEIAYPSPAEAWRLLCEACSLQVFLRRAGPQAAERCREAWLADHGLEESGEGSWTHEPIARLWLLAPA
jgi:SAM-dependent methyltransferase